MQPKTPATPEATTSKTLFVGNLSFSVERADVYVQRDFKLVFLFRWISSNCTLCAAKASLRKLVKLLMSVSPLMKKGCLGASGMWNLPHQKQHRR